jgi:hypothetical protein
MASVLLKFLRILCLARRYIGGASNRWALFMALIGRKLNEWWRWWPGKLRNTKPAESSFPGNGGAAGAGFCSSASGGPAVLKEYVVAASNVPASTSQHSLHARAEMQPTTTPSPIPTQVPATLSVDQSYTHNPYRTRHGDYLSPGNFASSSSNVSATSSQSRASDRLSTITSSHAPVGQPSEFLRSTYRQFGRSPDPSRSRGKLSRSPSPMPPLSTTQQPHHVDVVQTGVPTHTDAGGRASPTDGPSSSADPPSSSSNTQEPQRTSFIRGKKQRTTSVVFGSIQGPSSESLAAADLPRLTEEPTPIGSPTHSSFDLSTEHIAAPQRAIIASSLALPEVRYVLPENRFLEQINSEDVPRYTKNITMQVDCAIISIQSLHVLTDPVTWRKDCTLLMV